MRVLAGPHDGYGFEKEFCGCSFPEVNKQFRRSRVQDISHEIRRVKEYQSSLNWNPKKPKTPLAQCLFRRVASRLERGIPKLRLFISVGTRLDLLGVDCFFEYYERIATIDLTVSPFKENPRAHFVITRSDFLRNEHYQIGDLIAQKLA